jgi:hypothetical protein
MASRRPARREPEPIGEPPATREDVRVRWISDGWYWGPACPESEAHGALIDIQASSKWYCRHQQHSNSGIYTESDLIDIEWAKITSAAKSQEILPDPSEETGP